MKKKQIKIKLNGESRSMPWEELEKFNTEVKNLGYKEITKGKAVEYIQVYEYKGKRYELEEIVHYNTEMIEAILKEI